MKMLTAVFALGTVSGALAQAVTPSPELASKALTTRTFATQMIAIRTGTCPVSISAGRLPSGEVRYAADAPAGMYRLPPRTDGTAVSLVLGAGS